MSAGKLLLANSVLPIRSALMASMAKAGRDGDRGAWWAYRHALEAVGYLGAMPATLDLDVHGWALVTALERQAGVEREAIDTAASEDERREAWSRMIDVEMTCSRLGLNVPLFTCPDAPPRRISFRLTRRRQ